MNYLETLRARKAALDDQINAALADIDAATAGCEARTAALTDQSTPEERAEASALTEDETKRYTAAKEAFAKANTDLEQVERDIAELEQVEARRKAAASAPTRAPRYNDVDEIRDVRYMQPGEVRDQALRVFERDSKHLAPFQGDHVTKVLRTRNADCDGDQIARLLIATETPAYRSAFAKLMTQAQAMLTAEEMRATQMVQEFRAMSSTTTAGGFGVPVLIDPTIILTSGAADAPVLRLARVETITTDTWKGVSSAGVTWSFDTEASAVSDDSPTLAQPTVSVHEARGFIPYSVRIGQDYPSFAEEMSTLLAQGYIDLLATKTVTGTGTNEPWGIFTAIDQTAGSEVAVTTDGALGAVDFRKVWAELPERYRSRATWFYDVSVDNVARSFSTSGMGSEYTINLTDERVTRLFNRPVEISDYCPAFTGTTGAANILVVGDFSNYIVAQRAGMSVELVPHLFDVTDNRPTLQRGWLAWARVGGDSVADAAFRLLQNT